ncbi:putative F-box protein At1g33530 [Salvia hispanica]|uniref:putative F-box protein At1g33530 n=1 Tax=Salvia hispanica TaxID=49212 RepID=UPI002009D361|nr:putative F-box protein At1g33530 [Salvia hispanica]
MGYVVCSDEANEQLFRFNVPIPYSGSSIIGSANDMLLMWDIWRDILFTFNPITRNYIKLDPLPTPIRDGFAFGFGVSKLSGQYKILYVNRNRSYFVHNLLGQGKGGWRNISPPPEWIYEVRDDKAVFLNGNLHWLAYDIVWNPVLCCFDLETELFTSFSLPIEIDDYFQKICVLGDHLCVCDHRSRDRAVIWLMKDYGAI